MVTDDKSQSEAKAKTNGPVASLLVGKKRGRKPREKVYSVTSSDVGTKCEEQENIILHLPITSADLLEDSVPEHSSDPLRYDPTPPMNEPSPYSPNLPGSYLSEKQDNPSVGSVDASPRQDEPQHQSGRCEQFVDAKSGKTVTNLLQNVNVNDPYESTDICCWWDSESFSTTPCAIPLSRDKDGYQMHGVFCSHNCACAYLFNEPEVKDKIWSSYSLLNTICKRIYGSDFKKVQMAPPRQALKKFGGHLGIQAFREAARMNSTAFKLLLPPMTMVIPQVEAVPIKSEHAEIPVNKNKMAAASESLKLKRTKPLVNNHATLDAYLAITHI